MTHEAPIFIIKMLISKCQFLKENSIFLCPQTDDVMPWHHTSWKLNSQVSLIGCNVRRGHLTTHQIYDLHIELLISHTQWDPNLKSPINNRIGINQ